MNILEIANQCCIRAKEPKISNLLSDDDSSMDWLGYINQVANRIFSAYDWNRVKKDYSFTTILDPDTLLEKQDYDLPTDFDSMVLYYLYDSTRNERIGNESDEESVAMKSMNNTSQSLIKFRLMDGVMRFTYPIAIDRVLNYTYKSKNYVSTTLITVDADTGLDISTTTLGETFTSNDSIFLLNDELLILGVLYQRAVSLGFADAEIRRVEYMTKLNELIEKDGGQRQSNILSNEGYPNKTTDAMWNRT